MKVKTTFLPFLLLLIAPAAMADHGYRPGPYGAAHQWALRYAETAIRQVNQGRQLHCNYYGPRWSSRYHEHFEWALRVSRHKAEVELDRRDEALRHCSARLGWHEQFHWRYPSHDRRQHGYGRHFDRRHYDRRDRGYRRPHRRRG